MNNRKGFSFMEVMVVIAIIGVMTSVVLVYSGGNKIDKEVEGAAREVAAVIREAQNNALTGKSASAGCSYSFNSTDNSVNYGLNDCVAISYTLKNGVLFVGGDKTISFSVPWATVLGAGTVTVKKGSRCANVVVSSTGSITESKAGVVCP